MSDRSNLTSATTEHGLTRLRIQNEAATAVLYTQGAHITSFIPTGHTDLLWISDAEDYRPGKALRGGIPVCWPWFGAHPSLADAPAHGLGRTREWDWELLEDSSHLTVVRLSTTTDGSDESFPYRTLLELTVRVGMSLEVALTTHNKDAREIPLSQALHAYFAIDTLSAVSLEGLDGRTYYDKVTDEYGTWPEHFQIDREIDRIVLDDGGPIRLTTGGNSMPILERQGSRSLVVWNPWTAKSRRLSNFQDDDYQRMLCLETANVDKDTRRVAPGTHHSLTMTIHPGNPSEDTTSPS